jgi:hypothetical protein
MRLEVGVSEKGSNDELIFTNLLAEIDDRICSVGPLDRGMQLSDKDVGAREALSSLRAWIAEELDGCLRSK